jgi:hypothetical protein
VKVLLSIYMLVFVTSAKGSMKSVDFDALRAQTLLHARSKSGLRQKIREIDVLEWNQNLCVSQLQQKTVPSKCYELLESHLKSKRVSREQFKSSQRLLDQFCQESTESIRSLKDPRMKVALKTAVSSSCRNQILGIKKKLEYRAQDMDRQGLFFSSLEK